MTGKWIKPGERKPEVLLEDWCWCGSRLYGRFYRHSAIPDGSYCHTSPVIHMADDESVAETQNSIYSLGRKRSSMRHGNERQRVTKSRNSYGPQRRAGFAER
jgi:hypothetical protein